MNKRDTVLNLIHNKAFSETIPAAFFMHFDPAHQRGQAAVDKHLEFFRTTGMDFLKIQYENPQPASTPIRKPADWAHTPLYPPEFFEAPVSVAKGLVEVVRSEALVIMTLYSPFMWAAHLGGQERLGEHLQENPQAVQKGLEIMTENVLRLVRGCKRAGIDGFYVSTQGGETFRFQDPEIFRKYVKPTDLAVWEEVKPCPFNVLHICDYEGGYKDLTPFLDYPGQVVNSSLKLGERSLAPAEVARMFGRPFMGGLERKGVVATGNLAEIRQAVTGVLAQAPERFILAADCTVPGDTPWEHLKMAIDTAHEYRKHLDKYSHSVRD
jgi:uroporphyrinogen decarboxylase